MYLQDLLEERDGLEVKTGLGENLSRLGVLLDRLRYLPLLHIHVTQFQPASGVLGILLDKILVSLSDLLPFSLLYEILNLLDHKPDLFLKIPV